MEGSPSLRARPKPWVFRPLVALHTGAHASTSQSSLNAAQRLLTRLSPALLLYPSPALHPRCHTLHYVDCRLPPLAAARGSSVQCCPLLRRSMWSTQPRAASKQTHFCALPLASLLLVDLLRLASAHRVLAAAAAAVALYDRRLHHALPRAGGRQRQAGRARLHSPHLLAAR